jgi:glycosyltransferase involved in cell wall biosynthesis
MKVAFIARSSLYSVRGGDTIQIVNTAKYLQQLNVHVDIKLADEKINYDQYDLLHFFNLIRPADILPHISRAQIPFVVTPLLIDYTEYDKQYRKGFSGKLFRLLSAGKTEYIKTIARWLKGQQKIKSYSYLLKGQDKSIKNIINKATLFLPNSEMEYKQLEQLYSLSPAYTVIPNGIDKNLFSPSTNNDYKKDNRMVLCVARIEGLKNQLNLIKALNNSIYELFIIGDASVNQSAYYDECKKLAAKNIHFVDHLPQEKLIQYYQKAKVHVLPSWFETCGLSTLEAAAMGCNVVVTNKGYTSEYFTEHAFYCDPESPSSIFEKIDIASNTAASKTFQQKIFTDYTWQNAASKTYKAYKKILPQT